MSRIRRGGWGFYLQDLYDKPIAHEVVEAHINADITDICAELDADGFEQAADFKSYKMPHLAKMWSDPRLWRNDDDQTDAISSTKARRSRASSAPTKRRARSIVVFGLQRSRQEKIKDIARHFRRAGWNIYAPDEDRFFERRMPFAKYGFTYAMCAAFDTRVAIPIGDSLRVPF